MTDAQRLQIRASEQRARLNELSAVETLSDEQRTEIDTLSAAYGDTERQLRAAIAAEPEPEIHATATAPDAEGRERLRLRDRATVGAYIAARLRGAALPSECAEYGAACHAPAGEVPIDIFEADRPAVETHADAVTAAPATVGVNIGPIHPAVFAASIAPQLGITMPQVSSGTYSELRITTSTTAGTRAKGGAQESTAAVLSAVSTKPRSISARLSLRAEDILEIGTDAFEPALRANLAMALSNAYDNECLNGDGSGSHVDGLIHQLTRPTNPTAVADFDAMLATVAGQVDGLWARSLADVVSVVPADVYRLSATAFRDRVIDTGQRGGVSLGDTAAADYLTGHTGGWWTASRLPVAPTTGTNAKVSTGICYRRGQSLTTAVHPTWSSISISDPYTDSASATHHFTAHLFVGAAVMITQPDAYALALYKVVA